MNSSNDYDHDDNTANTDIGILYSYYCDYYYAVTHHFKETFICNSADNFKTKSVIISNA